MKPSYWIAICALTGAIIGYALYTYTGWLGSAIGAAIGILVGAIVSVLVSRKGK